MISEFRGKHFFLSNFYWHLPGITVEHQFQARKFSSVIYQNKILTSKSPQEAKRLGQTNLHPLREDWDFVRVPIMTELVRAKFQIPELQIKLLDTGGQELVEDNWWGDHFWGVCNGQGENHLGQILMQIREELS